MQRLEVSGAVRPLLGSLGFKRLIWNTPYFWTLNLRVSATTNVVMESSTVSVTGPLVQELTNWANNVTLKTQYNILWDEQSNRQLGNCLRNSDRKETIRQLNGGMTRSDVGSWNWGHRGRAEICRSLSANIFDCDNIKPSICRRTFNLIKPTGHVMHQQFNIHQLYALPTLYLCVLYLSENKQRLVPLTA